MIKKFIGIIVAVAVIVVIVIAALHHDKYTSMISSSPSEKAVAETIEAAAEAPAVEIPVQAPADSAALRGADSLGR